jgi:hypothetical protein
MGYEQAQWNAHNWTDGGVSGSLGHGVGHHGASHNGVSSGGNMLSFESDLDFPLEAVGLTGLGGTMGGAIGGLGGLGADPLAIDAELGLLLDSPGGGLVMDGGLLGL